jgi:UDP-N-acetylmuramoyl-L-alanyl-D-glutamate--2,6-diaminopimelate ligase
VATLIDSATLDLHHTTQNYRTAERRVLEHLSPTGVAIINADDAVSCRWLSELDGPALTYGLNDQAQITADIVEQNACETVFVLAAGIDSAAIRTTIIGEQHVSNCLAAAAAALAYGIDLPTIAAGIEAVQKLPARMERNDCGQDFAVFIDAAANACGLRSMLRTARNLSSGRVICVLGENLPTNPTEAAVIRGIVEKLADIAIVTDALTALDAAWLPGDSNEIARIQVAADRAEAMAFAVAAANQGDIVVIAGSRGPTGFTFGQNEVTDADVVRQLLYGLARPALRLVA